MRSICTAGSSQLNPITSYKHYLAASDPKVTPAHTANTAQFTVMRNHALSNSQLYFASNIVFSPLASIDDVFALSLVNTRKNLVGSIAGWIFFSSLVANLACFLSSWASSGFPLTNSNSEEDSNFEWCNCANFGLTFCDFPRSSTKFPAACGRKNTRGAPMISLRRIPLLLLAVLL